MLDRPQLGEPPEAMLARVRASLGKTGLAGSIPTPPPADDAIMRTVAAGGDLTRTYEESATKLGLKVRRTRMASLPGDLKALLAEKGVRRAAVCVQSGGLRPVADDAVARAGVATIEDVVRDGSAGASPSQAPAEAVGATFHAHFDVDASITDVAIAIAESGTLVHATGRARGRAPTGVPPLHIALLPGSVIVPDLLDYFAALRGIPGRELPSSLLLISGPSKTADIEGVLVTGIHGPNEVIVLLIEDA